MLPTGPGCPLSLFTKVIFELLLQGGHGAGGMSHCPLVFTFGQKVRDLVTGHGCGVLSQATPAFMSPTHQRLLEGNPLLKLAKTTVRLPIWKISGHSKWSPPDMMDCPPARCSCLDPNGPAQDSR
jgi:hypothetical protein